MKNKGFTLIELLAVIVILGVIALIAIPAINNIIEEVKIKSFETSMANIIKSVENDCETTSLKGILPAKKYIIENGISSEKINITGNLPDQGVISIDNECKTYAYLSDNNYVISKDENDENFSNSTKEELNKVMSKYENGTLVYFNPTTGSICKEEDVLTGVGVMDGCMRWYIFNDEKGNKDVNMILEHNIYKQSGYDISIIRLEQLTWVSGLNQRMMSLEELNKITNNDTSPDNLKTLGADGYSIYHWLYNYTSDSYSNPCNQLGCKYYGENSSRYWLSTKTENYEISTRIYAVEAARLVTRVYRDGGVGLRPVISISKTLLNN